MATVCCAASHLANLSVDACSRRGAVLSRSSAAWSMCLLFLLPRLPHRCTLDDRPSAPLALATGTVPPGAGGSRPGHPGFPARHAAPAPQRRGGCVRPLRCSRQAQCMPTCVPMLLLHELHEVLGASGLAANSAWFMAQHKATSSTTCCLSALPAAVLLEVPLWRSQPGAPAGAAGSASGGGGRVQCMDDPHTQLLFVLQKQARAAATRLGAHAELGCVCVYVYVHSKAVPTSARVCTRPPAPCQSCSLIARRAGGACTALSLFAAPACNPPACPAQHVPHLAHSLPNAVQATRLKRGRRTRCSRACSA